MPEEKPAHDKALELLVYAPVGVALYVRDMLPTMMKVFVSRGRREVESHLPGSAPPPKPTPPTPADVRRRVEDSLGLAKVVTESGMGVARGMAGTGLGLAKGLADTAVQGLGAVQGTWVPGGTGNVTGARTSGPDVTEPTPPRAETQAPPTAANGGAASSATDPAPAGASGPVPDVASLAIPDYDELSASQVVERLEGLDPESLDAIRRYESAHRGRNTILGKITQLG